MLGVALPVRGLPPAPAALSPPGPGRAPGRPAAAAAFWTALPARSVAAEAPRRLLGPGRPAAPPARLAHCPLCPAALQPVVLMVMAEGAREGIKSSWAARPGPRRLCGAAEAWPGCGVRSGLRSGLPTTLAGLAWREAARREPQAGACWATGLGKGDEPKGLKVCQERAL